jgi:hypothetical protein
MQAKGAISHNANERGGCRQEIKSGRGTLTPSWSRLIEAPRALEMTRQT